MNKTFASARLKTTTIKKETPYVVTRKSGNKYKDWFFEHAFELFKKWGNIKPYFEDVVVETFHFTDSKKKIITDKIMEEINIRQGDYYELITPEKYIVLMGEHTFFDIINEKRDNSPFFSDNMNFMSNDIYYNDSYRGRRVMNYQCHLVKGMQGFAFVPRVIVEKNVKNSVSTKDYTI